MIIPFKRNFEILCLLLSLLCFLRLTQRGEQSSFAPLSDGEMQHFELIKKELDFAQWRFKHRNGKNILLPSLDVASLLPTNIICTQEKVPGSIPTYRIQCSRSRPDGTKETIAFNLWICQSADQAREGVLRVFLNVSAPMPYLKKLWENQKVTYGDKSFGFDCWVTGNLVFLLKDGMEHEELAREIFSSIDNVLNAEPINMSGTAADIGIQTTKTGADSWTLALPKGEPGRQFVISYKNATVDVLECNAVIVRRKQNDQEAILHFGVIEAGKPIRFFQHKISPERAR